MNNNKPTTTKNYQKTPKNPRYWKIPFDDATVMEII